MNRDFIPVKSLKGELKISQKREDFGCSVTTREIVFQKPHRTYQVLFEDIISMIPFQLERRVWVISHKYEQVVARFPAKYYKIRAKKITVHNRHGVFDLGETEVIVPLNDRILAYLADYSGLTVIA